MAAMEFENENDRFDEPSYRRSASPQDNNRRARNRSASPNGHADSRSHDRTDTRMKGVEEDEGAINSGTNLFVTGIHPRLNETDVTRLFEKYGDVENCSIMLDPHTKESRGFGFVNMVTPDQAEAARDGLQGEVIDGRTLSIEKARRSRPRTPTPGKYFGPPKRADFHGPPRGGRFERRDDRRGGYGGGGYGRRGDDYRGGSRYDSYDRRRDYRDDYGHRRVDRYAGQEDRYGDRRGEQGERRGGGRGYYDRDDARAQAAPYADAPSHRESHESYRGRADDNVGDDRHGGSR
ncbi:hypothetical protein FQN57_003275 [Myotisia sp. PD_48]|nr:hypothetical protein FQN57_003275 [Myotisia sp. PD_48]